MEIIRVPWKRRLLELAENSKYSIKIASPFIKAGVCDDLLKVKQSNTKVDLITSYKLTNIYLGSLDIDGIEKILKNDGNIRNYSRLHAKIYLFDENKAIVTSANLTCAGLLRNFEYGVLFDQESFVSKISDDFDRLFNDENTGIIRQDNIDKVREMLAKIAKSKGIRMPSMDIEYPDETEAIELPENVIACTLSGWNLEVFKCVNKISNQRFNIEQIYECATQLAKIYPNNRNVKEKIRQQLQYLRDLGLIEFLGSGNYRKLWKDENRDQ